MSNSIESFEDILREKMSQPVNVKGRDATVMPMEAMVLAVLNDAMRGNLSAIVFCKNLTEKRTENSASYQAEQEKILRETHCELRAELEKSGIDPSYMTTELELCARGLMTLRRVARLLVAEGHKDLQVTPQKDGSERTELSTTNRIYNELYKNWKMDWHELRSQLIAIQMQQKMLRKK